MTSRNIDEIGSIGSNPIRNGKWVVFILEIVNNPFNAGGSGSNQLPRYLLQDTVYLALIDWLSVVFYTWRKKLSRQGKDGFN